MGVKADSGHRVRSPRLGSGERGIFLNSRWSQTQKVSPLAFADSETHRARQARAEIRQLQDKLFGRKTEHRLAGQDIAELVDADLGGPPRKRGGQAGPVGRRRRDYAHLPIVEEFRTLPPEARCGSRCGKPRVEMADSEDSQQIEIQVRASRRVIRRKRYRATCECPDRPLTITAPPAPKLIPKGSYGISLWVYLLLDKFSSFRPTARLLEQLGQRGLDWSPATITEGFQRLEGMLEPVYTALLVRNSQGSFHQADETRWLTAMEQQAAAELSDATLRLPCRKVLASLREHWEGLVRFVDHTEVAMDNNASERAGRGPAMGRKNYYGSGALWSARLAAAMFSIVATLKRWDLSPQAWLTWYFQQCAVAGGQAPADIQSFLPWNLSAKQRAALRIGTAGNSNLDSS